MRVHVGSQAHEGGLDLGLVRRLADMAPFPVCWTATLADAGDLPLGEVGLALGLGTACAGFGHVRERPVVNVRIDHRLYITAWCTIVNW